MPLTTPTSKPLASAVCDELILMMQQIDEDLKQDIQDLHERQSNRFDGYISKLSTEVISNTESLKKAKFNFNTVTQTISKLDHQLRSKISILRNKKLSTAALQWQRAMYKTTMPLSPILMRN
eukprot:62973-Ditylum_brightwellii.AAC.1